MSYDGYVISIAQLTGLIDRAFKYINTLYIITSSWSLFSHKLQTKNLLGKFPRETYFRTNYSEHQQIKAPGWIQTDNLFVTWHVLLLEVTDVMQLMSNTFFAQSVHINLASSLAAQLSLYYRNISSVAPP